MRIVLLHIFVFLSAISFGQVEKEYYDRVKLSKDLQILSKEYGGISNREVSEMQLLKFVKDKVYINEPVYDSIGKLFVFANYYEQSWNYIKESRVQLKLLSHYSEYLTDIDLEHHYRKLGEAFYNTGNYNLSIEFLNESLKFEGGAKKDWALSRIGKAYLKLDFIDSSVVYYKRALESTEVEELKLSHTNSLGYLYFLDGSYQLSELYYREALNLHSKNDNGIFQYCNILSNLASLELKKGRYDKSLFYLDSVSSYGLNNFEEHFQFEIKTKYIEAYLELEDCNEIEKFIIDASKIKVAESNKNKLKLLEYQVKKDQYCGDKDAARKSFFEYLDLRKEIERGKIQKTGLIEEVQRDVYKEHINFTKENLSLKEKSEIELQVSNSRLWKLFLVSTLLFLLISVGLWFWIVQKRQMQKRKEYARKLSENLLVQENKAIVLETAVQVKEMENQRLELMRVIDTSSKSNSMLNEISARLIAIKEKEGDNKEDISQLIQFMASLNRSEEISELIANNFGELEGDFKSKIRKQFSDLSDSEVQLLVFIRLGMTTKEMAQIKNVEPASIRIFKHRLKVKLRLSKELDLSRFIESI